MPIGASGKVETWFSNEFHKVKSQKTQHMVCSSTNYTKNKVKIPRIALDE